MKDLVYKYLQEELNQNQTISDILYKKISKYPDIYDEFCKWLKTRDYESVSLTDEGYTPFIIANKFPKFTGIGVFNVFVDLRDNKEKTLDNILKGFPRK